MLISSSKSARIHLPKSRPGVFDRASVKRPYGFSVVDFGQKAQCVPVLSRNVRGFWSMPWRFILLLPEILPFWREETIPPCLRVLHTTPHLRELSSRRQPRHVPLYKTPRPGGPHTPDETLQPLFRTSDTSRSATERTWTTGRCVLRRARERLPVNAKRLFSTSSPCPSSPAG